MPFDPSRGSMYEYAKAKNDIAEFKQAIKRQLPHITVFNELYTQVEAHCLAYRPFAGKPYRDWLGVMQAVWSRALAGELPAPKQPHSVWNAAEPYKPGEKVELSGTVYYMTADGLKQHPPATGAKKVKTPKPLKKTYNTVGVRFLRGHNLHKVYTYKVPKKVKLRLGEEIVVPSLVDGYEANGIAVVVELHATPQDIHGYDYKFVTGRITPVKA